MTPYYEIDPWTKTKRKWKKNIEHNKHHSQKICYWCGEQTELWQPRSNGPKYAICSGCRQGGSIPDAICED